MPEQEAPDGVRSPTGSPTIEVRCDRPGVVLAVDGPLDDRAFDLLGEVVRAALVTVGRAHRIHVDLSRARPVSGPLPRIVRQLERAGATITRAPEGDALPLAGGAG